MLVYCLRSPHPWAGDHRKGFCNAGHVLFLRALTTKCVNFVISSLIYLFTYDLCTFLYVHYALTKFTLQKT